MLQFALEVIRINRIRDDFIRGTTLVWYLEEKSKR